MSAPDDKSEHVIILSNGQAIVAEDSVLELLTGSTDDVGDDDSIDD